MGTKKVDKKDFLMGVKKVVYLVALKVCKQVAKMVSL